MLVEGRIFYWGRYIDWVITRPLLLLDVALLALACCHAGSATLT
jgi:bacteriorhodopsin